MPLRPDQIRAIGRLRRAYAQGARALVLQAPTGFGKTYVAAHLINLSLEKGNKVVFAAHRDDLVGVTIDRLRAVGLHVGRVQAGEKSDPTAPVQVCSWPTLYSRGAVPEADFVLVDECHRARAKSVEAVLAMYPEAKLLGLTATPERSDGKGLRGIFDELIPGPKISELQRIGALVPIDVVSVESKKHKRGVAMPPTEAVERYGKGRPTIVFARSVEEAHEVASALRANGWRAGAIDGETDREVRRDALDAFVRGELDVLCNCLVLTEGFDAPRAEVCVLARGCSHATVYLQAVGRVLRPHPGKERALLVDLRGAVWKHGLPDADRTFSIDGIESKPPSDEEVKQCPACGAVFAIGTPWPCSMCGFAPEKPTTRAEEPEELVKVEKVSAAADWKTRRAYFDKLVEKAKANGYKPGFVGMQFKEKFGYWPTWRVGETWPVKSKEERLVERFSVKEG